MFITDSASYLASLWPNEPTISVPENLLSLAANFTFQAERNDNRKYVCVRRLTA